MTARTTCTNLEADLIAAASGEATASAVARVGKHFATCDGCREEYARYRRLDAAVSTMRSDPAAPSGDARARLLARLADLRLRLVRYAVFATPLGPVLLAATEQGIALVEYVARRDGSDSWLLKQKQLELEADRGALGRFEGELTDYFSGRRSSLEWPLDLRFARSEFQRRVLDATAAVPYGAVSSYSGIARDIGRPSAVRAVASALRRNPVPIVVPCHRIVGSSGALVGYSGSRIGLKERLLGVEGVRLARGRREAGIDRGAMYAWDRSCREYCLPSCGAISEKPIGEVTLFASAREAASLGLSPCVSCRPDRHPLGGTRGAARSPSH